MRFGKHLTKKLTKKLSKLCNFKMINFSSVLNLFSKILFWGKIWDVHASKAGCLIQPYSFFIINDHWSVFKASLGYFCIYWSIIAKFTAQTKAQALLLVLLWISSISSLTLSYQNVWSVANVYCYDNIESRFGQSWDLWLDKFENKDQEILVSNLWRQNHHHKLAYKLYTLTRL